MAVGALEPQFYAQLLAGLHMDSEELPQFGQEPDADKEKLAEIFKSKTRDEWCEVFKNLDACVTPVLEMEEAPEFQHNRERRSFAVNEKGRMDPVSRVLVT